LGKEFATLTRYISHLRGGSQPILAQASDGHIYVVKFANNPQGQNLLFNESAGSELYRACKLSVPTWKPLMVTDAFLEQNPRCWMQTPEGSLRPNTGLCFGSRFLGKEGIRLLEILPGTAFTRIRNRKSFWLAWMIDICAEHTDNRQAIFLEDAKGELDAFFVDHGHLFGGPKSEQRKHFIASRYIDPRIYQGVPSYKYVNAQKVVGPLDVDQLWREVRNIPFDWITTSALANFEKCLNRLSNADLLQNVIKTTADAVLHNYEIKLRGTQNEQSPQVDILRPAIQTTESGCDVFASCTNNYRCA
jgi:hypothetical protein